MPDTTICVFCESGDHEHPAYDVRVMRCGCACHNGGDYVLRFALRRHLQEFIQEANFLSLTEQEHRALVVITRIVSLQNEPKVLSTDAG